MIFKSDKVIAQWDTWCYFHNDKYYAYYLISEKGTGEGFGVATSDDGLHWTDHGWAIKASDKMVEYLGTGSVWADPHNAGRFICNYSEHRLDEFGKLRQCILFAWSDDLIHWSKFGDDSIFWVDERYYERYGRWDCIFPLPRMEGGYYGTWTAGPKGNDCGIGFGISLDGLYWEALPPGEVTPHANEAGAIKDINNRYYGMFGGCFGETQASMRAYIGENLTGPYQISPQNMLLLDKNHSYFSRYFETNDGTLINHHVMSGATNEVGRVITYLAPFKILSVDDESIQRWKWWHGNEALKVDFAAPAESVNFTHGLFAELELAAFDDNPAHISLDVDGSEYRIAIHKDGKVYFSTDAAEHDWQREHYSNRDMSFGEHLSCRLLARRGMLELYVNDHFAECWTMGCPHGQRIRLSMNSVESAQEVRVWQMSL